MFLSVSCQKYRAEWFRIQIYLDSGAGAMTTCTHETIRVGLRRIIREQSATPNEQACKRYRK